MRGGPKLHPAVAALGGALAAAACAAVPPTGPTVVALPSQGKALAAFQQEDAGCRNYAGAAIGAAASEYSMQTHYNTAYTQCMYARGNSVRALPSYAGAGYPAYAGSYPYPSPWDGPGLYPFYPWYGGGLFSSDIVVLGGGGHHFHDGFPGGFRGGGFATSGSTPWRSGGFHGGGPATSGSTPWRR